MRPGFLALAAAAALLSTPAFAVGDAPSGDAVHGKTVFARCAICHTVTKGGAPSIGPNLFGVVGRKAAGTRGFSYSGALKHSGLTWTDANLLKWVAGPGRLVRGNHMAFAGLSSARDQRDVVAYLDTLK